MLPLSLCRRFAAVSAMTMIAAASSAARAQVNVEVLRRDLKDQPRFVTLDGNLTARLGNTEGVIAGASVFAGVMSGDHVLFGKAQGDYAAFGGKPSVDKSFAHLRYNLRFASFLHGEIFSQLQTDRLQRLKIRNVEGIGPRFAVFERPAVELYYGSAYLFEYEVLSPEPRAPDAVGTVAHRWSNYVSFLANLDAGTRFTAVIYVQPRLDAFSDVRLLAEAGFTVMLKKPLALKFGLVVRYDSQPPSDVLPVDFESKNSLSITF